jgi:hypothetical protein
MRQADKLFDLGLIVATAGAMETFTKPEMVHALERHASGDYGDLECCDVVDLQCVNTEDQCDWHLNAWSRTHGERILSSYVIRGHKLWCITERDRSVTTLLLPEDY